MPFRIPFAGEGEVFTPDSVLSHCYGALLPMFDTKEATTLRLLCKEFKSTVADFPWEDEKTVIRGSVSAWRACFPRARWANVRQSNGRRYDIGRGSPVVDADFVHFVGLRKLNMSHCMSVTDAAFVHLKGIHTLDMYGCAQDTITDAAFVHLKGIHTLNMAACSQITDAAFEHLKGIHTLDMSICYQDTITDAAFVHLKGIHTLAMCWCYQPTITDAAIVHLKGIHSLSLFQCGQQDSALTSALFGYLQGIKRLNIGVCERRLNLTEDSLKGIEWLNMHGHSEEQVELAKSFGYPVDEEWCRGV